MKLWLLRPRRGDFNPVNDHWEPWFEKAFGLVVRAETEQDARRFAREMRGETGKIWQDDRYTTCDELKAEGEPGVLLVDWQEA